MRLTVDSEVVWSGGRRAVCSIVGLFNVTVFGVDACAAALESVP